MLPYKLFKELEISLNFHITALAVVMRYTRARCPHYIIFTIDPVLHVSEICCISFHSLTIGIYFPD